MKNLISFLLCCKTCLFHLKQTLLFIVLTLIGYYGSAQEYIALPDSNFESRLIAWDIDTDGKNGKILKSSVDTVTSLALGMGGIRSLQGIEAFTALQSLDCSYNSLQYLDISKNKALKNLSCTNNALTSLDISSNRALSDLTLDFNQLISIDMTQNLLLERVSLSYNFFESLDLSKNTALLYLHCADNRIKSLNLGGSNKLSTLYCYNNKLKALDVSSCVQMLTLSCSNNYLEALDVTKNTALTHLSCHENELSSLDITEQRALTSFHCDKNALSHIDVSKNILLTSFSCSNNYLESLDVSQNTALEWLSCSFNPILKTICVSNMNEAKSNYYKDENAEWTTDCSVLVGIKTPSYSEEIAFYPNPSKGMFYIEASKAIEASVLNSVGMQLARLPLHEGQNQVTLSLERGLYYLEIGGVIKQFAIE